MTAPFVDSSEYDFTGGRRGSGAFLPTMDDPFVSHLEEGPAPRESHRYSSFDTQLFGLNACSPAQAKRALEAHLAETERRLEEASKLGTALIQQQQELTDKLKEVEQQQDEGEVGPELRRKLMDLEREYSEIGRETARAFLGPKRIVSGSDEGNPGTPTFDQKSPLSPALFAGQATNSPSKVSVPSRKQRNQASSRVHDIEFATEISTSLLAQVRQLQALLAEREEALKTVNLEKSRLELEAEGYAQRIRALDESEQRYKDENWALETQTHELMSAVKEATDRESRLNSSLSSVTAEKNTVERELEELKQVNARLVEEQTATQKANDAEIHLLRRNLTAGDAEKFALQQKLVELTSQNQELARAVAMRLRQQETDAARELSPDDDADSPDQTTPENSPPPSPNKPTPRHNHLETETLRSSLGHAHRMIQNLRGTIHREKTEKIELKRMLQEARDELETRRRDSTAAAQTANKRQKTKPDTSRKPPRPDLLGAGRKGITEIEVHDTDWEDNATDTSPTHAATSNKVPISRADDQSDEPGDVYQTATEAEDAFETANERETTTESEAFQTGIESMADDSDTDELTETEDNVQRTPRQRVPSTLIFGKPRDRNSWQSTASTSADEDEEEFPSPTQVQPRHRLKMKRSVLRRIRPSGEAPMASNSQPSSARESPATSFMQESEVPEGQSLFAELAELDGGDNEAEDFGSLARSSQASTPRMLPAYDSRRPSEAMLDSLPKPVMVDSGVMTEPWEPMTPVSTHVVEETAAVDTPATPTRSVASELETPKGTQEAPKLVNSSTQWTPLRSPSGPNGEQFSSVPTPPKMAWDERELDGGAEPEAAPQPPQLDLASIAIQETVPVAPVMPELSISYILGGITKPVEREIPPPVLPEVVISSIYSQDTEPVMAKLPEPEPVVPVQLPVLSVSSVSSVHTEPVMAKLPEPAPLVLPELSISSVCSEQTEPILAKLPEPEPAVVPDLSISSVYSEETEPVAVKLPEPERSIPVEEVAATRELPALVMSSIYSEYTEPVLAKLPEPEPAVVLEDVVVAKPDMPELTMSFINAQYTEPVLPHQREAPVQAIPELSLSTIRSVETLPLKSVPAPVLAPAFIPTAEEHARGPRTAVQHRSTSDMPVVVVAEDSPAEQNSKDSSDQPEDAAMPLGPISGNAVARHARQPSGSTHTDQGAQTILSAKQIDQILMDRVSPRPLSPPDSDQAKDMNASPFATPRARPRPVPQSSTASLQSAYKRPGSSASQASSTFSHPPLPADHREAIMAAEKRSMDQPAASPGLMGPPLAPASAFKTNGQQRPRTPNEQAPAGSSRTTSSRAKVRRESQSQMSRRSSISSFASELDERFNTQSTSGSIPHGYGIGTDPRMIQAITQTMIGEFLWKYTRKTVSGDMSTTRHRRYFWVHPYTRTLYWSEQDPQTAGKTELRTKSVAIEAVRVIADDNPYPPGLHCKSLEVVTPGRRVRFTATTSQRHETWFNALSYLLLRDSPEDGEEHDNNVTLEDIDEFNPGFRSSSRMSARMSFSSYNSRTIRAPKQRAGSALSVRPAVTPGRVSPALTHGSSLDVPPQEQPRSASRISSIFNTTIRGSFASLKGRHGHPDPSQHDGSTDDHDSAEELRHVIERQERDADRLENVRACCDGKHDVGSLSRVSRYSPRINRIQSHSHHH